jgi:DNA polymerase-1
MVDKIMLKKIMKNKPVSRLIIVDISSFIFRAFYAVRELHAPDGTPVNAVHGVLSMLLKMLADYRPTHIFLARDTKGGSFRNEIFDQYKANRSEPPEDLIPQFSLIEKLISHLKLSNLSIQNFEADDVIGSAVVQWHDYFEEILIATGDKDLMQFVDEKVKMLDTMKNKILGSDDVFEKMGVKPNQIVDYLSLVGDSSDNIPGLKGIGAKGAAKLLAEYGTLEECFKNKNKFTGKKLITAFEEHFQDALISKKLVTIKTDLDLTAAPESLAYKFIPSTELFTFLESLGMKSSILKLKELAYSEGITDLAEGGFKILAENKNQQVFSYEILTSSKQLHELIEKINGQKKITIDSFFSNENTYSYECLGFSINCFDEKIYYLPVGHSPSLVSESHTPTDRQLCKKILQAIVQDPEKEIICFDPKKFLAYCLSLEIEIASRFFDISQMHFVLDPNNRHHLENIVAHFLQEELPILDKKLDRSQAELSLISDYCNQRAAAMTRVFPLLKESLENKNLFMIYQEIDEPLILILAKMEYAGISINPDYFDELESDFEQQLQKLILEIHHQAGIDNHEDFINLKSPKQVGTLLFETLNLPVIKTTKTGNSTDSEVLTELDSQNVSEVPGLILKHRELEKLLSTYVKVLPTLADPKTNRLHTTFNQNVAATGRLSSDNPNLQNIPIRSENGRLIRKGFIAKPGQLLLSADYSQVELRILAHFSNDPTMIKSFQNNIDIHTQTAAEIMNKNLNEVTSSDRSKAKAVNFGLMYGQSSFGLAASLKISRKEARDYITMYFERFSKVKAFLDELRERCEKTGYAETLMGRKRFLPDINSQNRTIKSMAERVAINSPIQGTAADMIKIAMKNIDTQLLQKSLKSKMLLQVHDELIFEVYENEIDMMKAIVREQMENAVELKVPLKVDIGLGVNWFDLK